MAKFLVNIGGSMYVHADDEQTAIDKVKTHIHKDVTVFHAQAQEVMDPEDHTPEKRQAKFDAEQGVSHDHH